MNGGGGGRRHNSLKVNPLLLPSPLAQSAQRDQPMEKVGREGQFDIFFWRTTRQHVLRGIEPERTLVTLKNAHQAY
jgi:hypothetical protein